MTKMAIMNKLDELGVNYKVSSRKAVLERMLTKAEKAKAKPKKAKAKPKKAKAKPKKANNKRVLKRRYKDKESAKKVKESARRLKKRTTKASRVTNEKITQVFNSGVMLTMNMRKWRGVVAVPSEKISSKKNVELYTSKQDILSEDHRKTVQEMQRIAWRVMGYIKSNSIPFPVDGVYFIPKHLITTIHEVLEGYQEQYLALKQEVIELLEEIKDTYQANYPEDYDPNQYPTRSKLESSIQFSWSFRVFNVPEVEQNGNGLISKEMYEAEVKKVKQDFIQMKEDTLKMVANEMMNRLASLKEQNDNEKLNQKTINATNALLEKWQEVWKPFVSDRDFLKAMRDIQAFMGKVDKNILNESSRARKKLESNIKEAVETIENIDDLELKRGIEF